jgi:flagellin
MIRDTGRDVQGTINGAAATGIGLALSLSTDFLDVSVGLSVAQAQTIGNVDGAAGAGTPAFSILDGGANFQLSSRVDMNGKVSLGIAEMSTSKLGSVAQGFLNSLASGQVNNAASGDIQQAQDVVNEAIRQVSSVRGRLGAFQKNVVGATIRSLNINLENTTAAQSSVRDADFAVETANLTRQQILVSASTNVLSLANSQPQSALQLLG